MGVGNEGAYPCTNSLQFCDQAWIRLTDKSEHSVGTPEGSYGPLDRHVFTDHAVIELVSRPSECQDVMTRTSGQLLEVLDRCLRALVVPVSESPTGLRAVVLLPPASDGLSELRASRRAHQSSR